MGAHEFSLVWYISTFEILLYSIGYCPQYLLKVSRTLNTNN